MDIAQDMLKTLNDDPDLLKKVITGDESRVYVYDIETKEQSSPNGSVPEELRSKKARQSSCQPIFTNVLGIKRAAAKIVHGC